MTETKNVAWDTYPTANTTKPHQSKVHRTRGEKATTPTGLTVELCLCGLGIPREGYAGTYMIYEGGIAPSNRERCQRCIDREAA